MNVLLHDPVCVALAWLLTYLVHSTVLLILAALGDRLLWRARPHCAEVAWRVAMLLPLVTAAVPTVASRAPLALTSFTVSLLRTERAASTPSLASAVPTMPAHGSAGSSNVAGNRTWSPVSIGAVTLAVLALPGIAGLVLTHRRTHALLRDRRPIDDGPLIADLAAVTPANRRTVQLWEHEALVVPVAHGIWRPSIGVPLGFAARLGRAERRAALAHELGHVVARDPAWIAGAHAMSGAFWMQPINRLAGRRLRDLAEWRADAWASSRTGDACGLARCLTEVAGWIGARGAIRAQTRVPLALGLAAQRRSQLRARVEHLIESGGDAAPLQRSGRRFAAAVIVSAGLVAVTAPGVTATREPGAAAELESAQALELIDEELSTVERVLARLRRDAPDPEISLELSELGQQAARLRTAHHDLIDLLGQ